MENKNEKLSFIVKLKKKTRELNVDMSTKLSQDKITTLDTSDTSEIVDSTVKENRNLIQGWWKGIPMSRRMKKYSVNFEHDDS